MTTNTILSPQDAPTSAPEQDHQAATTASASPRTLHVYAVDWQEIELALGCGDVALMQTLDAEQDDRVGMTDAGPSEDLAIAHLIMGRPADGEPATWVYAFERLCKHFGRRLDTNDWQQVQWRDIQQASHALSSCHVSGSPLTELFSHQLPIVIPRAADGAPSIGVLEPGRVAQLLPRVTRGWIDLDPKGAPMRLIVSLERWLEEAEEEGWALVGIAE